MKVKIDRLDHFGKGITKVNEVVTFVPYTLPNEEVEIEITKTKKKLNEAKSIKIYKESPKRQIPFCPYFGICGGCDLEHMSYEDTLLFKKEKVTNILEKNKLDFPEVSIKMTNNIKFYRNKVTLKVANGIIGFYESETHNLVSIDKCYIAKEVINSCLEELKTKILADGEIVIRTNHNDELLLVFNGNYNFTRDDFSKSLKIIGIVINNKTIYGDNFLITNINNALFKYSYDSFFQVNNEVATYIFDYIKNRVNGGTILDLYCGVGTLSIMASFNAKKVYGIEIVPNAIKNALINAKMNKRDNVCFMLGDVAKTINKIKDKLDMIIVDPPRRGLDKITLEYLMNSNSKDIIYVSCDPVTLGRDLQVLTKKYDIKEVNAFDMFPYTYHVETIALLSLKDKENEDIKKKAFFENAQLLSNSFGIAPLMYGSLGLEYLTGENLNADDIDILIPKIFTTERWTLFKNVMEKHGYTLIDEHEHTFEKEGIHYSYAQIEELESFAGICISEIATLNTGDFCFKLLSLPQYLKVYDASSKDGYRVNVREKKDADKIAFIKSQLHKQEIKKKNKN